MKRLFILLSLLFCVSTVGAQTTQSISEKIAEMEKFPGFFTFY